MFLPKILNAGCYTHAQKGKQKAGCFWVGLGLKGRIHSTTYFPDGSLRGSFDCRKQKQFPNLGLVAPGMVNEFEYGPDRENWVVMFSFPAITFSGKEHTFYWDYQEHHLPLPGSIRLKLQEAEELRHLFSELAQLYNSSLPRNQLEAELLLLQIFHYFLRTPAPEDDRVEAFRKRLAEDTLWSRTILQHCKEMGINRDQLRKDFLERYKITPGEYRMELRLRKIRHLLAYSDLTLKEIAFEAGMKNLSHLSSFVRARCGKTPSLLAKEYRKSR